MSLFKVQASSAYCIILFTIELHALLIWFRMLCKSHSAVLTQHQPKKPSYACSDLQTLQCCIGIKIVCIHGSVVSHTEMIFWPSLSLIAGSPGKFLWPRAPGIWMDQQFRTKDDMRIWNPEVLTFDLCLILVVSRSMQRCLPLMLI